LLLLDAEMLKVPPFFLDGLFDMRWELQGIELSVSVIDDRH
jgi:hypothetical protein